MASTETGTPRAPDAATEHTDNGATDKLVDALAKVDLQEEAPSSSSNEEKDKQQPPRPLHVYDRCEVLVLSKSPLVKVPDDMPNLKDWFGDWNEQQVSNKKEAETSGTSTNTRDRRFRRDAEDGDAPARPSFRSTLSQPSQMGNFRHQSLRTTERERDADRERQRDERDREGQERLRNLSDRYDRERLASSTTTSSTRNKDRDSAPHLTSGSSARKKPVESSDDWRRAPESRAGRDDRSDALRRDRERPRESSRPRRDPSSTRRDRDRDRDERDRPRRGDDRDDTRRDKEDYSRRERDDYFRRDLDDLAPRDRDDSYRDRDRYDYGRHTDRDDEDSRRWRDDGRREERVGTRRDRERDTATRGWDRWEPSHDRDRLDDRDGRPKRLSGRDRRSGAPSDDRDDRKERDKDKEPAWMETYVPTTPGGGILGGQTEGELDGIQAWKKGMKEKERKGKGDESSPEPAKKSDEVHESSPQAASSPSPAEAPMDEIQLFKLMMKREAARKEPGQEQNGTSSPSAPTPLPVENGSAKDLPVETPSPTAASGAPANRTEFPSHPLKAFTGAPGTAPATSASGPRLHSLISPPPGDDPSSATLNAKPTTPSALDQTAGSAPRLSSNPPGLGLANPQFDRTMSMVDLSNQLAANSGPFNPPVGSRLLAFGSRTTVTATNTNLPPKSFAPPEAVLSLGNPLTPNVPGSHNQRFGGMTPPPPGVGMNMGLQSPDVDSQFGSNARATPSERSIRSFSPFAQPQAQTSYTNEDIQEAMRLAQANEAFRRQLAMSPPDRAGLGMGSDNGSPYIDLGRSSPQFAGNAGGYEMGATGAAAKGSRFAKFFDAKHRDMQPGPAMRKGPMGPGLVSTSPHPGQRSDGMPLAGMGGNMGDGRAMEELFAMLQNSAQTHRLSPQITQSGRVSAGGPYVQSSAEMQALQQQAQQQQFIQNARHESLYESRLDDRNFVPDGMVPGLRPAQRPRSREPTGVLFNDQQDDSLQFSVQRHPQQQRNLEAMYNGPVPTLYNQQAGMVRNGGVGLQQQPQFRNAPAVMASQQNIIPGPSQRLPPGLANLGGRPPHDPSQFLGSHIGGLHVGVHPNAPAHQGFNNFSGGGPGFNNIPGGRVPLPGAHHQNPLALNQLGGNQLGGLSPAGNMDLRASNQLLGMGAGGLGNGLRGGVAAGLNPQHAQTAQLQVQPMALRQQQQQQQQQQQHVPPHMMAHMLPPHIQQQQQNIHAANAQGAQDLMALLMGGHRE